MKGSDTAMRFNDLIESRVGMPIEEIRKQTSGNMARHIEKMSDSSLTLADSKPALSYRGNMLLAVGKITRDIDGLFNKTFGTR